MRETAVTMSCIWGQEIKNIFSTPELEQKGQFSFSLDIFIFPCFVAVACHLRAIPIIEIPS
jgi:hypothetical protein